MHRTAMLFKEGDPIDGLYMIKEGEFEITKRYSRQLNEKYNHSNTLGKFLTHFKSNP